MLDFQEVRLEDKASLDGILKHQNYRICDHAFGDMFIWQRRFRIRRCVEDGVLYVLFSSARHGEAYQFPVCAEGWGDRGRLARAVGRLREDARERGIPCVLSIINEDMRRELDEALPGAFAYEESRDFADYLYLSEDLITLRGKHLHAKRNFVNRFSAEYAGRFSFEEIGDANMADVLRFNDAWCRKNGCADSKTLQSENCAIRIGLAHLDALDMHGVALRLDGAVIAYAVGTFLTADTYLEQIEKAESDIPGAYQMINREFARRFGAGYTYVNREEDMGIEGLRRAKLSYCPALLNTRYDAVPATDPAPGTQTP